MVGKYGPRIIPREKELHSHLVYQPIRIKKKASIIFSSQYYVQE
jgi:hypothetical protein